LPLGFRGGEERDDVSVAHGEAVVLEDGARGLDRNDPTGRDEGIDVFQRITGRRPAIGPIP
jgi:hypothetical protein